MTNEHSESTMRPTFIGKIHRSSVAAIAVGLRGDGTDVFAGTAVGLFRSVGGAKDQKVRWRRLPGAPIGILCVAASPTFEIDRLVLVGTRSGVSWSADGGESWTPARMPLANSIVTALCCSPDFRADGVILAGTMQDGVLYSEDRGRTWQSRSIGMLDQNVFSVAFSRNFRSDKTVYAGCETGLYYSYNGARAWKQTEFPEASGPVCSVAATGSSTENVALFAGTERTGLYRLLDQGDVWQRLPLPGSGVNALDTDGDKLIAATDVGVFASVDKGASWTCLLNRPHVLSLAVAGEGIVAGLAGEGLWSMNQDGSWRQEDDLDAFSALGMALSRSYEDDQTAFVHAPQEGLWKTADGGRTWRELNGGDAPAGAWDMIVASDGIGQAILAASDDGVLVSRDGGESWESSLAAPASFLASSPDGAIVAVRLQAGAVCATRDCGRSWQDVAGPWDDGGDLVALAITGAEEYSAAIYGDAAGRMVLWRGRAGALQPVVSRVHRSSHAAASIFAPAQVDGDSCWYAAFGNQVWMVDARSGAPPVGTLVFSDGQPGEVIVSLLGARRRDGDTLFACTGRRLFASRVGGPWHLVFEFGDDPAVAVAWPPQADNVAGERLYGLLIGGRWCEFETR